MRREAPFALVLATLASLLPARTGDAQERRFFVAAGGGAGLGAVDWTHRSSWPVYQETALADTAHEARTGPAVEAVIGYRLSRHVGVRAAFGWSQRDGSASLDARIPHPFFFERPRALDAPVSGLGYRERAAHLDLEWWPIAGRVQMGVFAGVSLVALEADLVERVEHDEAYPFDEVSFRTAVVSRSPAEAAVGWSAGATLAHRLGARWALVLQGRYTRARVELTTAGGTPAAVDAGGLRAVALLRFAL